MPLIISFNLDPQVHGGEKYYVAGVSDIYTNNNVNYTFTEESLSSNQLVKENIKRTNNRYELTYKLMPGDLSDEKVSLGTLENKSDRKLKYNIRLFGERYDLEGISLYLMLKNQRYVLFDGENFNNINFLAEPFSEISFIVEMNSNTVIYYSQRIKIEIQGTEAG
jgi:hypothetical protein